MGLGETGVERGEPTRTGSCEVGKIRVRDLTMADDALHRNVAIRQGIRPEFVAWILGQERQDGRGGLGGLPLPDEQPD
jgi:hypothetical protein